MPKYHPQKCPFLWGNLGPNMTTWVSHCGLQCLRLTAWCFIALRTTAAYTGYEYTLTHPFNGFLSRTTQVSQYQKDKTNLDFTEARDSEWQRHQLGHYASLHLAPDR